MKKQNTTQTQEKFTVKRHKFSIVPTVGENKTIIYGYSCTKQDDIEREYKLNKFDTVDNRALIQLLVAHYDRTQAQNTIDNLSKINEENPDSFTDKEQAQLDGAKALITRINKIYKKSELDKLNDLKEFKNICVLIACHITGDILPINFIPVQNTGKALTDSTLTAITTLYSTGKVEFTQEQREQVTAFKQAIKTALKPYLEEYKLNVSDKDTAELILYGNDKKLWSKKNDTINRALNRKIIKFGVGRMGIERQEEK